MVTFRSNNSNNRRPPFRSNNNRRPPFRSNNEGSKFSTNDNFQRNVPGRNNHNAVKLIEKYNDLARAALANEDKILSENYFQHADHFTRILNEQESFKKARFAENKVTNIDSSLEEASIKSTAIVEEKVDDTIKDKADDTIKDKDEVKKTSKKISKPQQEAN